MFRNLAFCESRLPVTRSISRDAVIDTASALRRDTTTGALREHGEATYHQPMLLTDERIERRGRGKHRDFVRADETA